MELEKLQIREAVPDDLPDMVRMLADDHLGSQREQFSAPLPAAYNTAFDAISADPNNKLLVALLNGKVVATLQLTFTPSLSYRGGWRATLESVRTDASLRSHGIGARLVRHAIDLAREQGCVLVQLSTHQNRADAQRFYQRLGFNASHVGMKLSLT